MRMLFSVVSLLVVLAIVGVLATRQLKAVSASPAAPAGASNAAPQGASPGEQSRQMQEQVLRDVNKALEQGARKAEPEQ